MAFPRPLTDRERAVIDALVPMATFPDVEVYRAQIEHTTVVGASSAADIELDVGAEAPRANFQEAPLPIWALAPGPDRADEYMVMLWARDGVLSSIEVAWTGDAAPSGLPAARPLRSLAGRTSLAGPTAYCARSTASSHSEFRVVALRDR